MQANRRHLLAAASACLVAPLLPGCAQGPDRNGYKPVVGQAGKDVIWVPTPDAVVERMLDMVELRRGERLVDLGSGDGKIAIAAARRGARARGIEYNPDLVALSQRNARAAGVEVDFQQGDIFQVDFRDADIVTLYLLPTLNERLRPILLEMRPGTRVASHQFRMGDWQPDRTDNVSGREAHLWIVPARLAGHWNVRVGEDAPLQLQLQQQYQQLQGDAVVAGRRVPLELPRLRGASVRFDVPAGGSAGTLRFEGSADGARMQGNVTTAAGQRRPFTATRA